MSILITVLLGLVQGITEFLPISSSGHLQIVKNLFHVETSPAFNVICHVGSLLALCVVLRSEIRVALRHQWKALLLGTVPLFIAALFKGLIHHLCTCQELLGPAFLVTALLLWLGEIWGKEKEKKGWHPLVIGAMQLVALLPGVSRSGSTITGARLLGWSRREAVIFSFLLAIPAILGATVLELRHLGESVPLMQSLIALSTSFGMGLLSLSFLLKLLEKYGFKPFAWYCAVLGTVLILWR